MTNPVNIPSSAFNVERARATMLANVTIPPDILDRAIDKIYQKLEAKKTLFFTHRGEVVEKVDVEDTNAQLVAADKIFDIAGVKARERDAPAAIPQVALEMDSKTGVVRLVIGSAPIMETRPAIVNGDTSILQLPPAGEAVTLEDSARESVLAGAPTQQEEDTPQVVKVKRGNLPIDVYKALFGEPDDNKNGSS
jgi:hypothetical protein